MPELPHKPWAMEIESILDQLSASVESGLSLGEIKDRIEEHGQNRLRKIEKRSSWDILLDQFKSLIVVILIVAALISFLRQSWIDGGAITIVIIINTAVGFFTELRATRSIESLQQMDELEAIVRRDGKKQTISAENLVPGDIVILESGEIIAADLRLLKASKLQADESPLTGESVPVNKQTEPVEEDTSLAERSSMVYKGTAITSGQGIGIVVATGMETEIGGISSLVEEAEDEDSPLEERLDKLGQKLVWITLGVAAAVGISGFVAGRSLELMVETGIALAIAAVPEGLAIVATVALARGMLRMLQHNALMRRLSAVETLGSTNIICTDKTGTLTENRMTVQQMNLASSGMLDVRPDQSDKNLFSQNGNTPEQDENLQTALRVAVLCNDAEIISNGSQKQAGDPMEVALLSMGQEAGLSRDELREQMPEVERDSFDRETNKMATIHETEQGYFAAIKGAPQNVLVSCTRIYGEDKSFDEEYRQQWLDRNREMASNGLRVLGLATKTMDSPKETIYENLEFLGLVGLIDPPREDVAGAVSRCQQAGVRVIMITGDQPETARHIAYSVGLVDDNNEETTSVIHGSDLGDPDEVSSERWEEILNTNIFARVNPEQKLNLIDMHQDNGSIVAMTGDGVNDAPALKSADIGIAMGKRGTQVAREAADMILQDDAFPTIVAAVEQGRIIFENIRKFVIYLLSGNVGVIFTVGIAAIFSAPLPLLPLQILYLNMINDVFPALALGVGGGDPAIMKHPPRSSEEPIITRYHWGEIFGYGIMIGVAILGAFYLAFEWLGLDTTGAVTVAFLTLSISRLVHVFNMRASNTDLFNNEITRNKYVWGALVLSFALLLLAVYWPLLASILKLTAPGLNEWLLIFGASFIPLIIGQIYIMMFKKNGRRQS